MIETEFKKQMKIAARKQHYYSLSSMMHFLVNEMIEANKAGDAVSKNPDLAESIPIEVQKALVVKITSTILPLYEIAQSLKSYHQAFGEFPEWTKFTPLNTTEKLEEFIKRTVGAFDQMNGQLGKNSAGKKLTSLAFGEEYLKKAEEIKLKGE